MQPHANTRDCFHVSDVRFAAAPLREVRRGLLGWVSCIVNSTVRLEGIVLRRTLDDRVILSFPWRKDARGRRRFYVRPVDDHARRMIEREIIEHLKHLGVLNR